MNGNSFNPASLSFRGRHNFVSTTTTITTTTLSPETVNPKDDSTTVSPTLFPENRGSDAAPYFVGGIFLTYMACQCVCNWREIKYNVQSTCLEVRNCTVDSWNYCIDTILNIFCCCFSPSNYKNEYRPLRPTSESREGLLSPHQFGGAA
jgi:hypothetical protein